MKFSYLPLTILFIFYYGFLFLFSCDSPSENKTNYTQMSTHTSTEDCIKRIIARDNALGSIRNHACESVSLAHTIRNYTDSLGQLDYSSCPPEFTKALELHRFAWIQMIPLTEKYPDLRGEMHVLFDQIKQTKDSVEFNILLKHIWDTWEVVEKEKMNQQ